MRKITQESTEAFMQGKPFNKQNMKVEVIATEGGKPCLLHLKLHDNLIAIRHTNPRTEKIEITNAGWKTNTTKERLNGIPGVSIQGKKGVWYLNGTEWNGELTSI